MSCSIAFTGIVIQRKLRYTCTEDLEQAQGRQPRGSLIPQSSVWSSLTNAGVENRSQMGR